MATSLTTLVQRTRRFMGDWPEEDVLTASLSSSASSITVADGTLYAGRSLIEIDSEVLYVTANGSGTSASVRRGLRGSSAASHASSSTVLIRPAFTQLEVIDALNAALEAAFPWVYRQVIDTTLSGSSGVYEYSVPDMTGFTGYSIPYISTIELKSTGDSAYRKAHAWEIIRGATPKIKFRRALDGTETIRINGYGPLPRLASLSDTLPAQFPPPAEFALIEYAGSYLMASGEARRVRVDRGNIDNREQANQVGSSMRGADALLRRFYARLAQAGMPPMPKHVKSVI